MPYSQKYYSPSIFLLNINLHPPIAMATPIKLGHGSVIMCFQNHEIMTAKMVMISLTKDYCSTKWGLPNGYLQKQFRTETSTTAKLKFLCPPLLGTSFKKTEIHVLSPNKSSPSVLMPELLDAWNDEYGGVIINPESLPMSANAFASAVKASLSNWKMKGIKGVWLKILQEQADLVPIAIQEGFNFHHAEPGYVMLTYWIPNEPCMLPDSPSHHIGIGAFVINDKREVLVVKEKCPCSCSGVWKLPTGYINKSEDIFSGAIREVKEETGIETTFLKMVAFRHAHKVAFEQSDLLFVCMLKPLSSEITIDEKELQAAKWMTLDEFLEQPYYEEDHLSNKLIQICTAAHEDKYSGFVGLQLNSKIDGKLSYLYCDLVN